MSARYTFPLGAWGRLGNILWELAALMGIAAANHGMPKIDPNFMYRKFLQIPEDFYGDLDGTEIEIPLYYYQELYNFSFIKEQVINFYQPSEYAIFKIMEQNYPEEALHPTSHKTSIHIRHGDYLLNPNCFPQPTRKYHNAAINLVKSEHPATTFFVFSDDIPWCKNYFGEGFIYIDGKSTPVEVADRTDEPTDILDMFLMASMNEHIISNSSYAWWGAYLSPECTAIYPSKWWDPKGLGHVLDSRGKRIVDSYKDGIPSHWRELEC